MTDAHLHTAARMLDEERLHDQLDDTFPASDPPVVTRRSASDGATPARASSAAAAAPSHLPLAIGVALTVLLAVWITRKL